MQYDPGRLWDERAKAYGERCVMDLGLTESEAKELTRSQRHTLLSALDEYLGHDFYGDALDFGCGPGRFTKDLIRRCDYLLSYDPSYELVKMARKNVDLPQAQYAFGSPDIFFINATGKARFRFIWASHVFGGIPDKELPIVAEGLARLVDVGGFILFAEHVDERNRGSDFWRHRTIKEYRNLFPGMSTKMVDTYHTRGNCVGVFVAEKEK